MRLFGIGLKKIKTYFKGQKKDIQVPLEFQALTALYRLLLSMNRLRSLAYGWEKK